MRLSFLQEKIFFDKYLKEKDDTLINEIFLMYHSRLKSAALFLCRFLGRDAIESTADEIVDETFCRLKVFLPSWDPSKSNFYTLAYGIMLKIIKEEKRKKKKESKCVPIDSVENKIKQDKDLFLEMIEKKEQKEFVRKCIQLLPTKDKEIILLRDYDDLSYETIAEKLGITPECARKRYHDARKKLKVYYEKLQQI